MNGLQSQVAARGNQSVIDSPRHPGCRKPASPSLGFLTWLFTSKNNSINSELNNVQRKASDVLKLAAENERLEEMTMRLEAVKQRSRVIDVHAEQVKEEKWRLRRPA